MNTDVTALNARHRDGDGTVVKSDGLTQLGVIERLLNENKQNRHENVYN